MLRINVYVDGFNLYFGCLKGTPYRWLNLAELSQRLLGPLFPAYVVNRIRYFTAPVHNRAGRPGSQQRQQTYLRALSTIPNLSVHKGQFKTNTRSYPLADGSGYAEVVRSEEKGSDVNLASYLLIDALDGCYDAALVVSNDTDLVLPIALSRDRFGVAVGLAAPVYFKNRRPMIELENVADFTAHITPKLKSILQACQFPERLTLRDGSEVFCPDPWRAPMARLKTPSQ